MSDVVAVCVTDLPFPALDNIFHRLPVRSLAACCCVCKGWKAHITAPAFLSAHLAATVTGQSPIASTCTSSAAADYNPPNAPLLLIRLCSRSVEHYSIHGVPTTTTTQEGSSSSPLPFQSSVPAPPLTALPGNRFFRVAGSCAGLVLMVDDLLNFTHTMALWNPITRRLLHLPSPSITRDTHGPYESCIGLAYDTDAADFKVLRVTFLCPGNSGGGRARAELYSLRAGKWRSLMGPAPRYAFASPRGPMAFCNGYLHYAGWGSAEASAGGGGRSGISNSVLAFHVGAERFRRMRFPSPIAGTKSMSNTLFSYHGPGAPGATASKPTIAMFHVGFRMPLRWDLWVMSEYGSPESWVRLARAEDPAMTHPMAVFPAGLLVGGSPAGDVVGVEFTGPQQPIKTVETGLQGGSLIFNDVEGMFRTAVPICGSAYVETLALADVVDPERLVAYRGKADEGPGPAGPLPPTAGSADDLDTDGLLGLLQGMITQYGDVIASTYDIEPSEISSLVTHLARSRRS